MIRLERAAESDAAKITEIKTAAFNKEINTYLGRNGGPPGYNEVESELDIIHRFLAYKIMLDHEIVGAFFLIPLEETKMCFEDFVILPEYQGMNIATGDRENLVICSLLGEEYLAEKR